MSLSNNSIQLHTNNRVDTPRLDFDEQNSRNFPYKNDFKETYRPVPNNNAHDTYINNTNDSGNYRFNTNSENNFRSTNNYRSNDEYRLNSSSATTNDFHRNSIDYRANQTVAEYRNNNRNNVVATTAPFRGPLQHSYKSLDEREFESRDQYNDSRVPVTSANEFDNNNNSSSNNQANPWNISPGATSGKR